MRTAPLGSAPVLPRLDTFSLGFVDPTVADIRGKMAGQPDDTIEGAGAGRL